MKKLKTQIAMMLLLLIVHTAVVAQDMSSTTRVSQKASITQTIGTTEITIDYHSPLAKGRTIFGNVVPFDFMVDGKEYPWRAGSNKNTTIQFTHPVLIEGHALDSGSYGLHVYVKEKSWTFIFSQNFESWGSFQYDKKDDALRVTVPVQRRDYQDWLTYQFNDRKAESVAIELRWGESSAAFNVQVDVTSNIINDVSAKVDKTSGDYLVLARNELKRDPKAIAKAMALVDESISVKPGFGNLIYKADLLIESGSKKEGLKLKNQALDSAKGFNMYYYGLSLYLLSNDKNEAFEVLTNNAKKNPEHWIAHLALGEYYIKEGNQQKVIEHFEKSYKYAPDNWKNYARYLYLQNKMANE
jgi:hypothetical protein